MTEANKSELHPEETVDRLEEEALSAEAPESKGLAAGDNEPGEEAGEDSAEPAFEQDLNVEDLPGQDGGSAPEPVD